MTPNPRILNRKLHRWGAIATALPFLLVIATGLLLQLKKQLPWVQPPEQRTSHTVPSVTMPQVLAAAQAVPQAGIRSWDDIERVDVRPSKGIAKVIGHSRWELQVDLAPVRCCSRPIGVPISSSSCTTGRGSTTRPSCGSFCRRDSSCSACGAPAFISSCCRISPARRRRVSSGNANREALRA